jgi:hypothetical protein
MTDEKPESFMARWSRRKRAAARETAPMPVTVAPAPTAVESPAAVAPAPVAAADAASVELPPVESLTFESDFSAFMRPGVAPDVRQAALRKLLRDPRFNAMDGLDVYIDDYTKPSPLDPAVAERLAKALFTPTRVNAEGHVEDIPAEALAANEPAAPADAPPALAHEPVARVEATSVVPSAPAPEAPRGDAG